jgi:hypothetical protein
MKDHAALHFKSSNSCLWCSIISSAGYFAFLDAASVLNLIPHHPSSSSLVIPLHPLSSLVIPHHPASSLQSSSACSSSSSSLSFFWHHSLLSFSFVCSHSCTGIMLEDHASQQLTQLLEV